MAQHVQRGTVGIVGGGLAGLTAAYRLAKANWDVTLFEARQAFGGRAGSLLDPEFGHGIDHCQHVSMGCCTQLAGLMREAGLQDCFQRYRQLHYIDRAGRRHDFAANEWLPAPLHLAPGLMRLRFLSWSDRWRTAQAMRALMGTADTEAASFQQWLDGRRVSSAAQRRFWDPVIVSALSETPAYVSFAAGRKVFVEGFMADRQSFYIDVPRKSLGELYDRRFGNVLQRQGVDLQRGARVACIGRTDPQRFEVELNGGRRHAFHAIVLAVPWRNMASLVDDGLLKELQDLPSRAQSIQSSTISSVHLWFDRAVIPLPHAILLERLGQWVFSRGPQRIPGSETRGYYYQVVISAAHRECQQESPAIVQQVRDELEAIWPAASRQHCLHTQAVQQRHAVFVPDRASESLRPSQQTRVPGLVLAGDWTQTGWPSTMEGAVISGQLAAQVVLRDAHPG